MNLTNKILLTIISVIILTVFTETKSVFGQYDPQFSQYYANPLYLSPSFAGTTEGTRAGISYRNQWAKMPGAFTTYSVYVDHSIPQAQSGIGVLFVKDKAGSADLNTTITGVQYSYEFEVFKNWYVRPGLSFYFVQKSLNYNSIIFRDQIYSNRIDPQSPNEAPYPDDRTNHIDFSTGGLIFNMNTWAGLSIDHLVKPSVTENSIDGDVPAKLNIYGGYKHSMNVGLTKNKERSVSGSALIKVQGRKAQLDIGGYGIVTPMLFGIWYRGIPLTSGRTRDAIAVLVGLNMNGVSLGYSYDFTISPLKTTTGGSHELSLMYKINQYQRIRKGRIKRISIPCPIF